VLLSAQVDAVSEPDGTDVESGGHPHDNTQHETYLTVVDTWVTTRQRCKPERSLTMEPKAAVQARLDGLRAQLIALSHRIHVHPEVGFEEERASTWLAETLTEAGFAVTRGICDLPTAFMAQAGTALCHLVVSTRT
jgi:hypothetical protein